jgi:hypothetical protein
MVDKVFGNPKHHHHRVVVVVVVVEMNQEEEVDAPRVDDENMLFHEAVAAFSISSFDSQYIYPPVVFDVDDDTRLLLVSSHDDDVPMEVAANDVDAIVRQQMPALLVDDLMM